MAQLLRLPFLEMQTCPSMWGMSCSSKQPGVSAGSQPLSSRFCAEGAAGHASTTALSKALPKHVRPELQPRACAAMWNLIARPEPLPDPQILPAPRLTCSPRLWRQPPLRSAPLCRGAVLTLPGEDAASGASPFR